MLFLLFSFTVDVSTCEPARKQRFMQSYNRKSVQENICFACAHKSESFQKLSYTELRLTNENKTHLRFKKGETIAKQGAFVTHILYLKKGLVKIYNEIDYKNNLILDIHKSGKLLGLSALYGSNVFRYSIAALEDSFICAIDKEVIERLVHNNGEFAANLLTSVNNDLQNMRDKLVSLSMKQLNGRLADALLYLAEDVYKSDSFPLSLTRKDLAEFSGMSTMSVVRTMQDFKKEGLIENSNHSLKIIDKPELKSLSING